MTKHCFSPSNVIVASEPVVKDVYTHANATVSSQKNMPEVLL